MEKKRWLDEAGNVKKVLWALYAVSGLLIAIDLIFHKHAELGFDDAFGFYGIYGFVSCVLLVLIAKELRKFLSRGEDYYGEPPDDR